MILYIDFDDDDFVQTTTRHVQKETRRYYVTQPPRRAFLVLRNNLTLHSIVGKYVDANNGNEWGYKGFVLLPNELHTKITIYRIEPNWHHYTVTRLSDIVAHAPR